MLSRRMVVAGGLAVTAVAGPLRAARHPDTTAWAAIDLSSGRITGEGADRRMPMCSTFKWLLAACVLARADRGEERLARAVAFGPRDLLDHAPTVRQALGARASATLSVAALCEAAVTQSDNAAANLLLPAVGGPAGLTRWLRAIGDPVTRLDHDEPALNHVAPGAVHDTTTPAAMVRDLRRVLHGDVLAAASRARLTGWLVDGRTGATRLRAGVPAGWTVGEKTGTFGGGEAERSASGDVGFLAPPGGGSPILVAAYTTGFAGRQAEADRWYADLARRLSATR